MNKIYTYKPGDKIILLENIYGYSLNDIGFIVDNKIDGYVVNVPNKISISLNYKPNVWVKPDSIKYYYEKPLQNLFDKITTHCPIIEKDHDTIKPFIDSDRTLTNEELIICQNMWEKYNKR